MTGTYNTIRVHPHSYKGVEEVSHMDVRFLQDEGTPYPGVLWDVRVYYHRHINNDDGLERGDLVSGETVRAIQAMPEIAIIMAEAMVKKLQEGEHGPGVNPSKAGAGSGSD